MASSTPLELIAVEVRADVDQLERGMDGAVRVVDRSMDRIDRSVGRTEQGVVRSSRAIAAAQQNLGRQIADVGAQLASGSSPFLILAQQAPQVADAMSGMEGKAASVARFFAGPWGAALLAAGSVLAVVAEGALKSGTSIEAMTKELEKNAEKARMGAAAQQAFESTLYGAADASTKLNQKLREQNQTQIQLAQSTLALAEARRQDTLQNLRREVADAAIARRIAQSTADSALYVQGGTVGGASGFGQSLARSRAQDAVTKATEREKVARLGLAQAEQAVVEARIPLLDMKAAAVTDEQAAATNRHEEALGRLREEYRRTGDEAAYVSGVAKIDKQLSDAQTASKDKETSARRAAAAAKREEAKAARELARAQKELEASLNAITAAFDPAKAAAKGFRDTLAEIDKLQAAGLISSIDAISYKLKASSEQAKAIAEQAWKDQEQRWIDVGIRPGEMDGSEVRDQINRDLEWREAANERVAEDFRMKQEAQIRNLAGLYESLFRGGTGSIWRDFKEIGIRVIGETLARFTVARANGQGGNLLDMFGSSLASTLGYPTGGASSASGGGFLSAIGRIFGSAGGGETGTGVGFASGGSGVLGGRGGTDRNTLSLNGRPIANVTRGETLSVGSKALRGGSSGATVNQYLSIDARNSVTPEGFARDILTLSGQQAQQAAGAMGKAVTKVVPARLAQYSRDGT